ERHAVPGADGAIGAERVDAAVATGGEDHRLGRYGFDATRSDVDGDHTFAAAVLDQQRGDEPFVVAGDIGVLEARLEQRVQEVESALVGGEARPPDGHPAERAHRDPAVLLAAPGAAPV